MKFSIPLPTDPLYCPKLTCTVYDYVFKGWNQPIIGNFTLPIGELMQDLIRERQEETKIMEDIVEEIDKIIEKGDFQPKSFVPQINYEAADVNVEEYSEYSGLNVGI